MRERAFAQLYIGVLYAITSGTISRTINHDNDLKRRGIVILAKIASLYHFTILTCVSSISLYLCHSDQTTCFASTQIDKPFSQA